MLTGADFAWFKEERGLKHWVLYNTKMYEFVGGYMFYYEHLRYCPEYGLAPTLPFNATSCYKMFNLYDKVENLNFSRFRTGHVVDMCLMFENWTRVTNIDLSSFNTENVSDFCAMFNGCNNVQFRNSNGSRRVLVKGIGFCMTLTCTRYDVAILLRIMMLYYNTSTKTLDQKCQLTQVAADVCLHFMVVVLQLMFLTSPTLTQKT